MAGQANRPIAQIGYVVENLDRAIDHWSKTANVAPWTVFRNLVVEASYRGKPASIAIDVAMGYQGEVQIELIEPTSPAASPYRDDDSGAPLLGIHHIAFLSDDLEAELQGVAENAIYYRGETPGTRFAYVAMPGEAGVRLEYIQSPATEKMMADGIAEARGWDGSGEAVRVIDFAAR